MPVGMNLHRAALGILFVCALAGAGPAKGLEPELDSEYQAAWGPELEGEAGLLEPRPARPPAPAKRPSVLIRLDGSASDDPEGDALQYRWTQLDGPVVALDNPAARRPSFRATTPGIYRFALVVSDGVWESDPSVVEVEVERPNLPPEAIVPESVEASVGEPFRLDGRRSRDADGSVASYLWRQCSGPPLFLSPEATDEAVLEATAARPGVYEFELQVTDGQAASRPARCRVIVRGRNERPVARAGTRQRVVMERPGEQKQVAPEAPVAVTPAEVVAPLGEEVVLDGARSYSPRQRPLRYYWQQRGGAFIGTFTRPAGEEAKLAFTPPTLGEYVFHLTVSDGELDSPPQRVRVVVVEGNAPPRAVIQGPERSAVGVEVQLDGTLSFDREGAVLEYRWRQIDGPPVKTVRVSAEDPGRAHFTPALPGAYVFALTVSDGVRQSAPARAAVLVEEGNAVPEVEAPGRLRVRPGEPFVLQARGRDADGDTLTYCWRQVEGPPLLQTPAAQQALELQTETKGCYRFTVTASDGRATSHPLLCEVRVAPPNRPPEAVSRARLSGQVGKPVALDGRASFDPDGDGLTYRWEPVDRSVLAQGALRGANTAQAEFTPKAPGRYAFRLTVMDGETESTPVQVDVQVAPANRPPRLRIAGPTRVQPGEVAILDVSESADPEGEALTIAWTQRSGPAPLLRRRDLAASRIRVEPHQPGLYTFEVRISDSAQSTTRQVVLRVEEE